MKLKSEEKKTYIFQSKPVNLCVLHSSNADNLSVSSFLLIRLIPFLYFLYSENFETEEFSTLLILKMKDKISVRAKKTTLTHIVGIFIQNKKKEYKYGNYYLNRCSSHSNTLEYEKLSSLLLLL